MKRDVVIDLIDWMYWVNHQLLDACSRLSDEAFAGPASLGGRDLRATLVHELDVEWSWRLALEDRPESEWGSAEELRAEDFPTVEVLRERWATDESEMRAWLSTLSEADLEAEAAPGLSSVRRPMWQFLAHIVSHAAQQQADAATLLTLAGASPGDIGYLEFLGQR
jgi:uncharacterized damage-inducible protein DinB